MRQALYQNTMFQFTRSRGARQNIQSTIYVLPTSFNSRAREERDDFGNRNKARSKVSIHALARSATKRKRRSVFLIEVSIHALARSATNMQTKLDDLQSFNSRAREERDLKQNSSKPEAKRFNSRAREERDKPFINYC